MINEDIAYDKSYEMLKPGGYLAMFMTRENYKDKHPDLYADIQKVYDDFFVSDQPYRQRFNYQNTIPHGFISEDFYEFYGKRIFTADEYVEYISTHYDHITINAAYRDKFFNGVRDAVNRHGGTIEMIYTYALYLCRK